MAEEDIISSHAVHSKVECFLKCLHLSTCVGYNYRPKSNRYAVNCQLSNKTRTRDQGASAKGDWTFFKDLKKVREKDISELLAKKRESGLNK